MPISTNLWGTVEAGDQALSRTAQALANVSYRTQDASNKCSQLHTKKTNSCKQHGKRQMSRHTKILGPQVATDRCRTPGTLKHPTGLVTADHQTIACSSAQPMQGWTITHASLQESTNMKWALRHKPRVTSQQTAAALERTPKYGMHAAPTSTRPKHTN